MEYAGFSRDVRFSAYRSYLSKTDPDTLPIRADRPTFWINTYSIKLIVDHMLLSRIGDIGLGLPVIFWPRSKDIALIGTTSLTLNYIEHDVVRGRNVEP